MVFSTILDFFVGRAIHASEDPRRRRGLLIVSLVGNLGMLAVFKYTNFLFSTVNGISTLAFGLEPLPLLNIILPLGISFYTFQTLSYTIDIHRRELAPTSSILSFALYVAFFPQLVAGPIVRASHLLPQLERGPRFGPRQMRWAFGLVLFGLIKKVVFADNFAQIANTVYADPAAYSGWLTLIGTYAFAFQIYCDFSGYTDMARGIAALMGYDIGLNFDFPYFAVGVRDFWKRWHISLSTWLRDYLYIPLGGNRGTRRRVLRNIMVTMLLGGLWHGANWTFVVWGGIHGVWINAEHALERVGVAIDPRRLGWPLRILGTVLTFHIVCVTWVFFRAESVGDALDILVGVVRPATGLALDATFFRWLPVLLLVELLMWRTRVTDWILRAPLAYWILVGMGLLFTLALGDFRGSDFVYFQF
jgi:D-alanyl-lipoteichoic acid acyltransferase DltB (MBOAT superfamily)